MFNEYEDLVARDGNKMLPMDGTIHPLTAQVVLSYVKVWRIPACQGLKPQVRPISKVEYALVA
jgi:hypothetical protein